jgi:glutathione S-transferase
MAAHIVLEESSEEYEAKKVDLAGGEQRTEAYLKINPLGRVPALLLDNGEPLAENTAILPFLGKRFDLWPEDALAEAKALSLIGFFASSVHVAFAHVSRPERYASDLTAFPTLKETGLKAFHGYLEQIDGMLAEREWFSDRYTVLDSLWLRLLHVGCAPPAPDGRSPELHSIQEPDAQTASCRTCGGRRTDKGVNKQEPDYPAALPRCNRSLTGLRSLVSGSTRSPLPRTT